MTLPKTGRCVIAGAGPGDLGLVTLSTRQWIERADVIVYDYLCNAQMLRWSRAEAERIYVGKKAGAHTLKQEEINALLVGKAKAGQLVLRLKGGDPFLFGRGGEEAEALAEARVPFEIVPGVTSALSVPAYAGIPVTHREHNAQVTIFTGHEDPTKPESTLNYAQIAQQPGTKIMLMGVERLSHITAELAAQGMSAKTPVALTRWGTTGGQQTVTGTLATIGEVVKKAGFTAPAVAVFGEVVKLREKLAWFEKRPLFGKRIVVTRTRKQAGGLSQALAELGADVLELPTIRIEPPKELLEFGALVRDAHTYDWLVFTSPNGVEAFFEMFYKIYDDAREIGGVRFAAIGPATAAAVKKYRMKVDLQPKEFVAEKFVEEFEKETSLENTKLLIVRAEVTREILAQALTKQGAIVDEALAYRTVPETEDITGALADFQARGADVITFTSSSTVENFLALKLTMPTDVMLASIGPVTTKTLREHGLKPQIEAKAYDIPGLVEAIKNHCTRRG